MIKKKFMAAIIMAACLTLTGCNGGNDNGTATDNEVTAADKAESVITIDGADNAKDESAASGAATHIGTVVRETNKYYHMDYTPVYDISYDQIRLTDEDAADYPELDRALKQLGADTEAKYLDGVENGVEEAKAWMADMGADMMNGFIDKADFEVTRADSNAVSVRDYFTSFLGGAHGMYGYWCYNYDPVTGALLTIDDVFTSKELLADTVYEKLSEYGEDAFMDYSTLKDAVTTEINDGYIIFGMDYIGVHVYFNPYDIGPYAVGVFEVVLPYSEYAGTLIKDVYGNVPENYVMSFPDNGELLYDLNGDGKAEQINIISRMPEEMEFYETEAVGVSIDGTEFYVDQYCFGFDYKFVKNNGKCYVMFACHEENDYTNTLMIDITGGSASEVSEATGEYSSLQSAKVFFNTDDVSGDYYMDISDAYTMDDPQNLCMSVRSDVMSTSGAAAHFTIDENGRFVKTDENELYYILSDMYMFTAKTDVKGTEVAEDGSETGEYVISAGTVGRYYRTDNVSQADVKLEDGTIVRFEVDKEWWPYKVNGTALDELFDGIIFAG